MKVVTVKIKKLKKLADYSADFNGKNVIIAGENGVGKSTLLQAIDIAFGNKKHAPSVKFAEWTVIADRDGNEWKFRVKIKDGKPIVETFAPDGTRDIRVSALKEITGAVDFDIDEFVLLSESEAGRKKQVEIYKSLLPEEVKEFMFDQEKRIKANYDLRKSINSDIKILKGAIEDHPLRFVKMTPEMIDTETLSAEVSHASEHNAAFARISQGVADKEAEIKKLEEEILNLKSQVTKGKEWMKSKPEIDINEKSKSLSDAQVHNSRVESYIELQKKQKQLEEFEEKSGEYTALIDSSKQAVSDTVKSIDLPIDGLEFDDDMLMYNSIPVEIGSMSTSEIQELGVRMKIAENPSLPLIIKRAESIGTERMRTILNLAKEMDMQVIAEEVERGNEELTVRFIEE